jgi:N-acetyl-anhydromuramyl-L-alanine amidase AmpD
MGSTVLEHASPAFSDEVIPVEFLVLHYTACTLEETLKLFCTPGAKTCAHFVLDTNGDIYDLGRFWSSRIRKGAHAGASSLELGGKKWESFNAFSIGIELVNLNGNVVPYSEEQYQGLAELVGHLKMRFPELRKPERVVGHEQIAGFRGKADPGIRFDWKRFYERSYAGERVPSRESKLTKDALARFEAENGKIDPARMKPSDWPELSSRLEKFLAEVK